MRYKEIENPSAATLEAGDFALIGTSYVALEMSGRMGLGVVFKVSARAPHDDEWVNFQRLADLGVKFYKMAPEYYQQVVGPDRGFDAMYAATWFRSGNRIWISEKEPLTFKD